MHDDPLFTAFWRMEDDMKVLARGCVTALLMSSVLFACTAADRGGGGGAPKPEPIMVEISPPDAALVIEEETDFTATVTGSEDTSVTWSTTGGIVTGTGTTITYTAPATEGIHTITAMSKADPDVSAAATVTVTKLHISIEPATAELLTGEALQLTATVTGAEDQGVTWHAEEGIITGSGNTITYTAPELPGTYSVTATSTADTRFSASATMLVRKPGHEEVVVSISPEMTILLSGQQQQFTVTVTGTENTGITWSTTDGTVAGTGRTVTYTAPGRSGTYTVTATSEADPTVSASATVTVKEVVEPSITSFEATPADGVAPLTTTFTWGIANPDGVTASCTLNAGDGSAAYTLSPCASGQQEHIYAVPGVYAPTLTLAVHEMPQQMTTSVTVAPGMEVGEWEEVATYLDYRVVGANTWLPVTGFVRVQPLNMGRAIHTVELTNLQPGTEYEFRLPYDPLVVYPTVVADPTTNMTIHWQTPVPLHENQPRPESDAWVFRFRTFPGQLSSEPVRIGFGGDIKQNDQPYEIYEQVWQAYASQDLHALVITGDWVYDDNDPFKEPYWGDNRFADLWDAYKRYGQDSQGRLTPILPGIGNHEVGFVEAEGEKGYNGTPYHWVTRTLGDNTVFAVQFPTVPYRWYFVTDIGDYASIVMLDSEHINQSISSSGSAQTQWLEDTLNARTHVPTVIPTYHVAGFTITRSFTGGLPTRIRDTWHPIFDRHDNIEIVFAAHEHAYGETHWIDYGKVVPEGQGIKYLGAGHMGTLQDRSFWNPATTWYLKDAFGYRVKTAESGETHPDDGRTVDATGDYSRHVWIVELTDTQRLVRSFMTNGTERTRFTY